MFRSMKKYGQRFSTFLVCFILFSITVFAHANDTALKKISFIPHWVPQAQFAGYYVAYEKGMYRKHGIGLTIIEGGPDRLASDYLREGKADFATSWLSTAIQKKAHGIDLVNIAQIVQRSALMLVARKSSGIQRAEDMNGKKVGLWDADYQLQPRALFRKYNLNVRVIPQSFSVNLFLRGGVDIATAMWYNEYHTILNSGLDPDEITGFFFHDYGLNFPEDGIYTMEDTLIREPELCRAFVAASLEGWKYAFEHPEEALDIMMKYAAQSHLPTSRTHQKWMLERMKDLILPKDGDTHLGTLLPSDYDRVARSLKESGLTDTIPDFAAFHRKCGGQ